MVNPANARGRPQDRGPQLRSVRSRLLRWTLILGAVAVLTWGGQWLFWRHHLKRFAEVRAGVLYRTAQPTEFGLRWLVDRRAVRTVVSLQLYDFHVHGDLFGLESGPRAPESEVVRNLGARMVQWPMGEESYWPWVTPWQFEEFYRLFDDPANLPVAVHCMGGRHRTGTFVALFRLEYDRWPIDRTLEEMYSFKFGGSVHWQEHNLRTYLPRPHPDLEQWQALLQLATQCRLPAPSDYDALVRELRRALPTPDAAQAVLTYLDEQRPFALQLAARIAEDANDPIAIAATRTADAAIAAMATHDRGLSETEHGQLAVSAGLIADFGDSEQQLRLFDVLTELSQASEPSPVYEALVAGVTNRYTPNRIGFLAPLLADERPRIGPACRQYRYCDTAAVRIATINDSVPVVYGGGFWPEVAASVRAWIAANPDELALSTLRPPTGHKLVKAGSGPEEEDLSRMR